MTIPWSKCAAWLTLIAITGCATPYIHPESSRHTTPALRADHAVMGDGYALPLKVWHANPQPRAIVLALHGMNDYSNAYAATGPYLAQHHITTYAYDQRGFGASAYAGLWHGEQRMIEDVGQLTRLLRAAYPNQPLYLMGESMGGAVVLSALSGNTPPLADGVILLAPAVWARDTMPFYQRLALWLAVHTMPGKRFTGEGLEITPSDNIEMLKALGQDPLFIKATRVDVMHGVTNLMDSAQHSAWQPDRPILILYGQRDEIIPKRPTCRLFAQLPEGPDRHWQGIVYPDGYHMLTRDLQGEKVLNDIAAWILHTAGVAPQVEFSNDTLTPGEFCAPAPPTGEAWFDDDL